MRGTTPESTAALAKLRVDQWVRCSPTPMGSQQASCSTCTRTKGGKLAWAPAAWFVPDRFEPSLLEAAAQIPNSMRAHLQALGQLEYQRASFGHRDKSPSSPGDALLGVAIADQPMQKRSLLVSQMDPMRRMSPHSGLLSLGTSEASYASNDYIQKLFKRSTSLGSGARKEHLNSNLNQSARGMFSP